MQKRIRKKQGEEKSLEMYANCFCGTSANCGDFCECYYAGTSSYNNQQSSAIKLAWFRNHAELTGITDK